MAVDFCIGHIAGGGLHPAATDGNTRIGTCPYAYPGAHTDHDARFSIDNGPTWPNAYAYAYSYAYACSYPHAYACSYPYAYACSYPHAYACSYPHAYACSYPHAHPNAHTRA